MAKTFIRFVPNGLSLSRILIALCFPFSAEKWWLPLIIAGAFSDFLDGWIARRYRVQSWQGGLLDGIGDKLFVLSVLITFAAAGKFSAWWLPALLTRDLLVAYTAAYAAFIRSWESFSKMEARWSGKVATAGLFLLFVVVLLFPKAIFPTLVCATLFSVIAAFDYGRLFLQELQHRKEAADSR